MQLRRLLALLAATACSDGTSQTTDAGPDVLANDVVTTDVGTNDVGANDVGTNDALGPTGAVFYSDWSTATGTTANALTDGNRWDDTIGPHANIAVVAASEAPGAPSTNVYRVTNSHTDLGYNWVEKSNLWPSPQSGQTHYYRVYLYNATDDAQGDFNGGEASYHPLEFASSVSATGSEQWNLIFSSRNDGTFPFKIAPLAATFPQNRWIPSSAKSTQAYPKKKAWYRIEWSLTRTAADVTTLHARIYDAANVLAWDDTSLRDASLDTTLGANGAGIAGIDDLSLGQLRIGTNGGSVWSTLTADQYIYWAAVCIRSDTWCGPYASGEH